mmetsp:Transcript_80411/g.240912  ORF Transcript_80411/g.240912 Transcript_80411/m.240912 type:complete len:214 (+) Transcript_80411:351-992(+)
MRSHRLHGVSLRLRLARLDDEQDEACQQISTKSGPHVSLHRIDAHIIVRVGQHQHEAIYHEDTDWLRPPNSSIEGTGPSFEQRSTALLEHNDGEAHSNRKHDQQHIHRHKPIDPCDDGHVVRHKVFDFNGEQGNHEERVERKVELMIRVAQVEKVEGHHNHQAKREAQADDVERGDPAHGNRDKNRRVLREWAREPNLAVDQRELVRRQALAA